MHSNTPHSPVARTVLRPRDPVAELMIVSAVVMLVVPLLLLALLNLVV